MKSITDLVQHGYEPPSGFGAVQPAVHKASTVFFENVAALRSRQWKDKSGYTYGLHGTPTTFTLEERLATLEGGLQCLLAPSGLAAVALVSMALLGQGDEVLIPDNAYAPNREWLRHEMARWGVSLAIYDPADPADLAARLTPRSRLVWLEAAGSVTLEFPDLPALLGVLATHRAGGQVHPGGLTSALDNTWGAGLAFDPFDLAGSGQGVDVSVHALTKYPSGGGDVLMGSVVTRDGTLHQRLKNAHMHLGLGVGANDAEAVLRGLPSIALRYEAHDRAARAVAQWFTRQPEVARVLHPALADSPGHAHWQSLCTGAAGLVSVVFAHEGEADPRVEAFIDALRLFRIGYSWGGPVSLVMPYGLTGMRRFGPLRDARGTLVRFSLGLESVPDLLADLSQALQGAFARA